MTSTLYIMVTKLINIFTLIMVISFSINEAAKAETLSKKFDDKKGEIYEKIYETLHCKNTPCDMRAAATLYEELLKFNTSTHARIGYANVLKKLAKTEDEWLEAQEMDNQAAYEDYFICMFPDKIMYSKAKALSTLYRIGIFFPPDLKQSQRWANIAQYYKEKHLYK